MVATEQAFLTFFRTRLDSNISNSALSIDVLEGTGKFISSALGGSKEMHMTIKNASDDIEIVKCTSVSGDTLTVERGQDGTAADDWKAGDIVDFRLTAAILESFEQEGHYRDITYNPNSADLAALYDGEEVRETGASDCQNRWWKHTTGTRWRIKAGEICDTEYQDDDGYVFTLTEVLLMHFEDESEASLYDSAWLHDVSISEQSNQHAALSSDQVKLGSKVLVIDSNVSNRGAILTAENPTVFDFSGTFTFECFAYFASGQNVDPYVFFTTSGAYPVWFSVNTASVAIDPYDEGPGSVVWSGLGLNEDTWYHFAVTRDSSNTVRCFIDGTVQGTTYETETDYTLVNSAEVKLGYANPESGFGKVYYDEIRLRTDAVWTESFTPPTSQYTGLFD